MLAAEVIIVGGGPAGSSCAWRLQRHGMECMVLDRQAFPREKLCGGWVTPQVIGDLELNIDAYPYGFLTFNRLQIHLYGLNFKMKTVQHSIRRYEFDDWLLKRCGATVKTHYVKHIEKRDAHYVIDGQYRCKFLVGAGGTKCPVYRALFKQTHPRARSLQAVALEREAPYPWQEGDCHLWFFDKGLPGYSWYVPKGNGYVNVGTGAMVDKLSWRGEDIKSHWRHFVHELDATQLVNEGSFDAGGYSYYLRAETDVTRIDNAFVIGDAAGLATRDLCEGIGPAVKSGLIAADAIATGSECSLEAVSRFSLENRWARKFLENRFVKRKK
jgi:flavin-dependent dehydrogenase